MKRPSGYDAPRSSRRPSRNAAARVSSPREARAPERDARASSRSSGDEVTEPISLPRLSRGVDASRDGDSSSSADFSSGEFDAPARNRTASARSLERQLRRAQRDRKRVERREVKRFTESARRRRRAWLLAIGSIVGVVVLAALVAISPVMALRTIRVEGASEIDAAAIRSSLESQLGKPLALVDSARVDDAITALPLVRSYSTETLPPDTLLIRIAQRTPIGAIENGGSYQVVDAARVVLSTASERPAGIPLIATPSDAGFDAVSAVLRRLPDDLRAQIDSITATSTDDVTFTLTSGQSVAWGGPEEGQLKASVLSSLIGATGGSAGHYDVSSPRAPVTG